MKNENGLIIAIEGPSGVGKDTVSEELRKITGGAFQKAPSTTTRQMRESESQGHPYFFVDDKTFDEKAKVGEIFEWTLVHGTKRGMSTKIFDDMIKNGAYPIKDVDRFGLDALKKVYGERVVGIFITADKEEVKKRLIGRGDEGKDLEERILDYDNRITTKKYFDYCVENEKVENAAKEILKIINNYENKIKIKK